MVLAVGFPLGATEEDKTRQEPGIHRNKNKNLSKVSSM
jgi:hypothetical protein